MLQSSGFRPASSCLRTIVRFAGGGGRPGGVPTFNWKQKKELKLNVPRKEFKVQPYGYWSDIEEFFDPKKDVMLPWDQENKSFDDPLFAGKLVTKSDKKRLDVRSLYGSNKPFGIIPRKHVPEELKRYNYERIFGEKHRQRRAAKAAAESKQ